MGNRLVDAAYDFAAEHGLGHPETRLLVWMSSRARDSDSNPVYFAGSKASEHGMGLTPERIAHREGVPLATAQERARKALQRAVRALVEVGAITPAKQAYRGSVAVYSLTHEGGASVSPFRAHQEGDTQAPPIGDKGGAPVSPNSEKGGHLSPERGTSQSRKGDTQAPPKEEEHERGGGRAYEDDASYALDTPPTPPPPDSPFCADHDETHTGPCWACKRAREGFEAAHGKTPRRPRSPQRSAPQLRLVRENGREVCADGRHKPMPDGTCAYCTIRPADLAALRGTA